MAAAQPPLLYTSQESSQGIGATHSEQVFLPWWKQPSYPFLSGMQLDTPIIAVTLVHE